MKLIAIALLTVAPALAFASAKSEIAKIDSELQACLDIEDNQSTAGMNDCTATALGKADDVLNKVYQNATADLKKKTGDKDEDKRQAEILSRLVKAQRAWIVYRDANAELNGSQMLGGSGESTITLGTLYSMTKDRAIELDSILNGAE